MCHLFVGNYSNWQARKQKVIFVQTYTVLLYGCMDRRIQRQTESDREKYIGGPDPGVDH